jgi:hypothetical protein
MNAAMLAPPISVKPDAAEAVHRCFAWHPSEVAGLTCLAALGYRGAAELRSDGLRVEVGNGGARVYAFDTKWAFARNAVANALVDSGNLDEIDQAVRRITGRSELDDERQMLRRCRDYRTAPLDDDDLAALEARLLRYSRKARAAGVEYLTLRRVSELLELSPRPFRQMCRYLDERHPARIEPPAWQTEKSR